MNLNYEQLTQQPNHNLVFSLMFLVNDYSRQAYLFDLLQEKKRRGLSEPLRGRTSVYLLVLLASQLSESLELVRAISESEGSKNLLKNDPELQKLIRPLNQARSSDIGRQCKRIRNELGFHYHLNGEEIKTAVRDILKSGTKESPVFSDDTKVFFECGYVVYEALLLNIIGGKYTGTWPKECNPSNGCDRTNLCNHQIRDRFMDDLEKLGADILDFAKHYLPKYCSQ